SLFIQYNIAPTLSASTGNCSETGSPPAKMTFGLSVTFTISRVSEDETRRAHFPFVNNPSLKLRYF
ncbi:hypothetical protein ABEY24_26505, partial [Peribacillus frigoritolerans]|uniref:hypothetical protein n=1 Tax=Peribacillus frigoritolerans TaxID=450367 RepID=UPI003D2E3EC3